MKTELRWSDVLGAADPEKVIRDALAPCAPALPPSDQRLPADLNEAAPEGHCAVEAASVHRCLDEHGIPRTGPGGSLSLWGRVEAYAKWRAAQRDTVSVATVGLGHGHVNPRPDGVTARCGGPAICRVCAAELAAKLGA